MMEQDPSLCRAPKKKMKADSKPLDRNLKPRRILGSDDGDEGSVKALRQDDDMEVDEDTSQLSKTGDHSNTKTEMKTPPKT